MKPIWSNYYGEVAQFVHEIGLRGEGVPGAGFPKRAAARLATARAGLMPTSQKDFVEAQEELSSWLEQASSMCARSPPTSAWSSAKRI